MEHQKIINLLDNTWNKPNKFGTKNWVEINDDACGTYNTNSQIKLKPSMFDTYIPMSGTTTVAALAVVAPFTNFINEMNKTQTDNAKNVDVVMLMYNSKISGIL